MKPRTGSLGEKKERPLGRLIKKKTKQIKSEMKEVKTDTTEIQLQEIQLYLCKNINVI